MENRRFRVIFLRLNMKAGHSQSTSAGKTGSLDGQKDGTPGNRGVDEMRQFKWLREHGDEYRAKLLQNIKTQLPQLDALLAEVNGHWGLEDGFYRFYHGSFKVFGLQGLTEAICKELQALLPDRPLNRRFSEIVTSGTGHDFQTCEENWDTVTRAIVEACFHAHYFLKLACQYGRELDVPPDAMPSGWAAVLYLFDLR